MLVDQITMSREGTPHVSVLDNLDHLNPDIIYNIALFATGIFLDDTSEEVRDDEMFILEKALDTMSSFTRNHEEFAEPSREAQRLSLVSRAWFRATHKLTFKTLCLSGWTVRRWSSVISRLQSPMSMLAPEGVLPTILDVAQYTNQGTKSQAADSKKVKKAPTPRIGTLATRLSLPLQLISSSYLSDSEEDSESSPTLMDDNPRPDIQSAALLTVSACPNIQFLSLVFRGFQAFLGPGSIFVQGLHIPLSICSKTLKVLSLSVPANAESMAILLDAVGELTNLRVLVIHQGNSVEGRFVTPSPPRRLPHLRVLSISCNDCTGYPFLKFFGLWTFDVISTLVYRGSGQVDGLDVFVDAHKTTLTNIVVDYHYLCNGVTTKSHIPSTTSLTHVVVPYSFAFQFLPKSQNYPGLKSIGLTGRIAHGSFLTARRADMEIMRYFIDTLLTDGRCQSLSLVHFVDIHKSDVDGTLWHVDDADSWNRWFTIAQSSGRNAPIDFLDAGRKSIMNSRVGLRLYGSRGDNPMLADTRLL